MNMDGQTSQQSIASAAVSDADSLRFWGFIGSIGSVLTGGFDEADTEEQDEPKGRLEETLLAPSQQPTFLEGGA